MSWWVHSYAQAGMWVELISQVFWVLLSITLHELAHGWTAIWQGDRTPIERHHMTLNPVVHMGMNSLVVFALCGIAWGMMPVNPHRFRDGRRGDMLVSAAGPAMNLLLAIVCVLALVAWLLLGPDGSSLHRNVAVFLETGAELNVLLGLLNLLPIPPLDGAHILGSLSRRARDWFSRPEAMIVGTFAFLVIFFMSPIGELLWRLAFHVTIAATDGLGALLGAPRLVDVLAP